MNLAQLGSLLKEARTRSLNAEARSALEEGKRLSPAYGQLVGELKRNGFTDAAQRIAAPLEALPWGGTLVEEAWENALTQLAREICQCGPWAERKVSQLRTQFVGTLPNWKESLEEVFRESLQSAVMWTDVLIGIVLGWTLQRREGVLLARPPSDRCEPSFTFLLRKDITDGYRQDCVHGLTRRVSALGVSSTEAQALIQQLAANARMAPASSRTEAVPAGAQRVPTPENTSARGVASGSLAQRPAQIPVRSSQHSGATPVVSANAPSVRKGRVAAPAAVVAATPAHEPVPEAAAVVETPLPVVTFLQPVHTLPPAEQWSIALRLQPALHDASRSVESVVAVVVSGVHALPAAPEGAPDAASFQALRRFPVGAVGVATWTAAGTPGLELASRALGLALRSLPQSRLADVHVSVDWPGQLVTREEVMALLDRQYRPLAQASYAWKRVRMNYRPAAAQDPNSGWASAITTLWTGCRFGDSRASQAMGECGLRRCCLYDSHDLTILDAWFDAFDSPGRVTGTEWVSLIDAAAQSGETSFPSQVLLQVADAIVEDEERPLAFVQAARQHVVAADADVDLGRLLVRWLARYDIRFDDPALKLVQRLDQLAQDSSAGSPESATLRGLVRLSDECRSSFPDLVAYADASRAQLAIAMYDWNGAAKAIEDGLSVASDLGSLRKAVLLGLRAHVEACQGRLSQASDTIVQACAALNAVSMLSPGAGGAAWMQRLPAWRIMAAMDQPQAATSAVAALFQQAGLPLEPVAIGAIAREDDAELFELHFVAARWLAFHGPDELVRAYANARPEWSTGTGLRWTILYWYRGWILSARHPKAAIEAWQTALALVRDVAGVGMPRMWEVVVVRTLRARGVDLAIPEVQLGEGAFPAQRKAVQLLIDPASSYTDRATVLQRIANAFPFALH